MNPDAVWRARGSIIEFSPNGGMTFSPVHTASQVIAGGVVAEGDAVWFFARNGLIVRSSLSGWIESFAPQGSQIVSLQATNATNASIVLLDGSTLVTRDGGVTWTRQEASQKP